MLPLFRTSDMEQSVLELDAKHEKVMVRALHVLLNPIRIRVKRLEAIRPFLVRNDPAFDREITQWNAENGTIVNYRPCTKREPPMPHDTCLLCECPIALDVIEQLCRDTKLFCVVYRPPSWREHEEYVFSRFPSGTACKRLIQEIRAVKPSREYLAIAQKSGIPTAGTYAVDEKVLLDSIPGLVNTRRRAMRSITGKRYSTVQRLIPRIAPTDRSLLTLYEAVKALPTIGQHHIARDSVLSKAMRFWKLGLRALVRAGNVQNDGKIGFYFMDGLEPDYAKIETEHQLARLNLLKTIECVDNLGAFA